jgi:Tfp pilus assembly protein FimT
MYCKKNKGVSFIEILIIIGIVALMTMFLAPNLLKYYYKTQVEKDAQRIVATLRMARDNSISQKDSLSWGVHFENATNTDFFILFKGDSYSLGTPVQRVNLSANVIFSNIPQSSSTDIIFSKLSGLPASTSSIIISLANDSSVYHNIKIFPSGEINY